MKLSAKLKVKLSVKAKGEAVGESRFAALSLKLLSAGRTGDLERAAKDEAVRRQLYQEYGI